MLTLTDMRNALTGSFLLARRDTSGLRFFDVSLDGFWRSFLVIIPIAPFYVWYAIQEIQLVAELGTKSVYLVVNAGFIALKVILLVLDWFIFPIVMIFITRLVLAWPRYIAFIAVYNWSSLFLVTILIPPALLYASGLITAETATFINLFFAVFVLYFRWYTARSVLETDVIASALIVVLDLTLSLLVNGLFTGYFTGL